MDNISIKHLFVTDFSTEKLHEVESLYFSMQGASEDIHAGVIDREVSLIPEKQQTSSDINTDYQCADFGQNIVIDNNFDINKIKPLDILQHKNLILQVTQIGRTCNNQACSIFNELHKCVLPTEAIYARVLKEGNLKKEETFTFVPYSFKVAIITVSSGISKGIAKNTAAENVKYQLENYFQTHRRQNEITNYIIDDDVIELEKMMNTCITAKTDIIITVGGTGLSNRDITPDVVKPLLDKEIPGYIEHIRSQIAMHKPNAILSRGIAGIAKKSLVITLPGNKETINDYMNEVKKTLLFSIFMIQGIDRYFHE